MSPGEKVEIIGSTREMIKIYEKYGSSGNILKVNGSTQEKLKRHGSSKNRWNVNWSTCDELKNKNLYKI